MKDAAHKPTPADIQAFSFKAISTISWNSLRDFIDCGELGDSDKRECIWGCDWKPNPLYPLDYNEKFELIFQKINDLGTVLQQLEFNLFDLNKDKIMLKLLL